MADQRLVAFGYPEGPRDPRVDAFIKEFVAQEMEPARVDDWVTRVAEYVIDGAPQLAADPELAAMMLGTVRDQWQTFVTNVLAEDEAAQVPFIMVPSAAEIAVETARRHLDLGVLVNAYRMAQRAAWDYATSVVAALPDDLDHAALLIRFWSAAGAWFDAVLEHSTLLHAQETRRIQQRGDAQRYDLVKRVLEGDAIPPRELSAGLGGYPVAGEHAALILVAEAADTIGQLEGAALRLAQRLQGSKPLIVQPGGRELWCWIAAVDPDRLLAVSNADLEGAGVRVTIGGPYAGTSGFVTAYDDARRAQRAVGPRSGSVAHYDAVAPVALLAADPTAEAWVRRVLGKLASDEPAIARLRETLGAYIRSTGSVADVAAASDLHKNTVRYRLDQAEKLLPHRPASPVDIGLAIQYYDALLATTE